MVLRCRTETERVAHRTGSGRKRRTVYSEEEHRVCTSVRQGTRTLRQVVRPQRWCAELDDVGGAKGPDHLWYQVDQDAYQHLQGLKPGSAVTLDPLDDGC